MGPLDSTPIDLATFISEVEARAGRDIAVLVSPTGSDANILLVELRGTLAKMNVIDHPVGDDEGWSIAARFAVGDAALNFQATDFTEAFRTFAGLLGRFRGTDIEIRP